MGEQSKFNFRKYDKLLEDNRTGGGRGAVAHHMPLIGLVVSYIKETALCLYLPAHSLLNITIIIMDKFYPI